MGSPGPSALKSLLQSCLHKGEIVPKICDEISLGAVN